MALLKALEIIPIIKSSLFSSLLSGYVMGSSLERESDSYEATLLQPGAFNVFQHERTSQTCCRKGELFVQTYYILQRITSINVFGLTSCFNVCFSSHLVSEVDNSH